MSKITYIDKQGSSQTIDVENGLTVMEGAIQNDIPGIDADCGGSMACATCHISSAGAQLRAEITSPALGHTRHFPAFRFAGDDIGTLQNRYAGCNTQVRAKPFALQREQYRNLEYFHTYMANGLPLNGPGSRK